MYLGHVKVLLGMFLSLKTLYRKRTVIWPFYFYTIIRTLSKNNELKLRLLPSFKNICFTIFYYLFTGFMSYGAFYLLVFENVQNLILYVSWLFMTMLFMFMNMHSIIDKKVHIFLKSNK
ncbi:DUF443 family protein [Staphylococcus aureus]|uniref:DUF443 family protein n=1 Tax=Staphylococcus aureus TaxID=1280 RepID=UPI003BAADBA9